MPVHAEPVHAEPVHADPVQAEPVHAEPVHADPVQAEPSQGSQRTSISPWLASTVPLFPPSALTCQPPRLASIEPRPLPAGVCVDAGPAVAARAAPSCTRPAP